MHSDQEHRDGALLALIDCLNRIVGLTAVRLSVKRSLNGQDDSFFFFFVLLPVFECAHFVQESQRGRGASYDKLVSRSPGQSDPPLDCRHVEKF